jgi:hypothetical protein
MRFAVFRLLKFAKLNESVVLKTYPAKGSSRLLKKCHCERFSAKQSAKIKGLLRQKTPRNDNCGVFHHPARQARESFLI